LIATLDDISGSPRHISTMRKPTCVIFYFLFINNQALHLNTPSHLITFHCNMDDNVKEVNGTLVTNTDVGTHSGT
jgi:hypothetical protein